MRARNGLVAAALALGLVLVPVGVAPANAAHMVRTLAVCSGSSLCASENLPILTTYAAMYGTGGATAATGATAAATATGLGGTLGFGTVVGASGAAIGVGIMKLTGVDEGLFVETDPEYNSGTPGQGATVEYQGSTVSYLGLAPSSGGFNLWCFARTGSLNPTVELADGRFGSFTAGAGGTVNQNACKGLYGSESNGLLSGSTYFPGAPPGFSAAPVQYGYATGTPLVWQATSLGGSASGYHGTIRTSVQCTAPGWVSPTTIVATARVDVDQGERLPVPSAACDPGQIAVGAKVEYQADGTTTWVELGSGDSSATVRPLIDDYPDCFTVSGEVVCQLELQRRDGTRWETCGELASYCPGWVDEWSETPELYRCKYGDYTVSINLCSAFRKPGTLLPNHDAGEESEENPTGAPVPLTPTSPVPRPEDQPTQVRDEAGNPVPIPADVPGGQDQPRECWPSGFGIFNPLSWVLMPIRCAFEPSPEKVQQFRNGLRDKWEGSTPGLVVGGITAAVGAAGAVVVAGGCSGIEIPTGWLNRDAFSDAGFPASFTILDACPGSPLQPWAAFSFLLISGSMLVLAVRVVPGMVGKLVNYGGVSG